jgi:hypothetical protein
MLSIKQLIDNMWKNMKLPKNEELGHMKLHKKGEPFKKKPPKKERTPHKRLTLKQEMSRIEVLYPSPKTPCQKLHMLGPSS